MEDDSFPFKDGPFFVWFNIRKISGAYVFLFGTALPGKTLAQCVFFPQIAIAIGVLTSNKGGGRRTTLADWTWHQGAIAGCSRRGAIAGCHCSVLLQGVGGGEGDGQLWGSGRGAIAGCHCWVLLQGVGGGEGDGQLWGVDVVPLVSTVIGVLCGGGG